MTSSCFSSTCNDTNQRPRLRRAVADRIRMFPASARARRWEASSWRRTVPILGRVICLPSGSIRIVPVVNRQVRRAFRFDLKRGMPILRPLRLPLFDFA